ncbi:acetolactate decarboxylase [Herbiconiux moechotypicola]|uniref:Alpha-acetolactate decarboxylase n=1 Tax=Herbiconiux moechotypicola TaxID=637393 RepID=A0ABN3DNR3_9MICO|nr:acetolactate decarboxylase [Herbiconiux moechotypicola]MCS5730379.1 acetolactate decarboxylase [Herbiconiux moechotypicola]
MSQHSSDGAAGSRAEKAVEQFSLVNALVVGLFDGVYSVQEVARRGDLGLGCGDHMDGELVLVDGEFRLFHGDGTVTVLGADDSLAFAEVVRFEPEIVTDVFGVTSFGELVERIRGLVVSDNLFHAVRMRGVFEGVGLREAKRQSKPYLPLAEAVRDQREVTVPRMRGTLAGFLAPRVFQGISVAGPHLHVVDESGLVGGHVLGLASAEGVLEIESYSAVTVRLPSSEDYLAAELAPEGADAAIRHAESDHQR